MGSEMCIRDSDWIARGQIDVTQMVSHRLDLEEIDRAMLLAHERDEDALKVTLDFAQGEET